VSESIKNKDYVNNSLNKSQRIDSTEVMAQKVAEERINGILTEIGALKERLEAIIESRRELDRDDVPVWAKLAIASTQPNNKPEFNYYIFKK